MHRFIRYKYNNQLSPLAKVFQIQIQHGRERLEVLNILLRKPKHIRMAAISILPHIILSSQVNILETAWQKAVYGIFHSTEKVLQIDFLIVYDRNLLAVFACDCVDGLLTDIFLLARRSAILPGSRLPQFSYIRNNPYYSSYLLKGVGAWC